MKAILRQILRQIAFTNPLLTTMAFNLRKLGWVDGVEELDKKLLQITKGSREPNLEQLDLLKRYFFKQKISAPQDPFSQSYVEWNQNCYQEIVGNRYDTINEISVKKLDVIQNNFFPYLTQSPSFVGHYLYGHAFLLKHLPFRAGSKVLELGAGWGNLSLALALMNMDVTAVELNETFIKLIEYRAKQHERNIHCVAQDMVTFVETTDQLFDAIIFEAAFHHCSEHVRLLKSIKRILKPGGVIVFADEPIMRRGNPAMPYPWGLRLDLASLLYVRYWGWMELGFRDDYFGNLLNKMDLKSERIESPIAGLEDLHLVRRINE